MELFWEDRAYAADAREYFWIMVPAKDTVVGYSPAMLNPKPMIPTRISGVDVLNKSRMKKPTSPNPMISKSHSFWILEDSHAHKSRPARIMIQRTLAVTWDREAGSNPVSLKYVIIHPITPCSAHR